MILWALTSLRCPLAVELYGSREEAEAALALVDDDGELFWVEAVDLAEPAPISLN